MTTTEVRAAVVEALTRIAPEVDPTAIDATRSLRDELDLDSMDFLNLLVGIHERTGLEIPESDYGQLGSLDALVAYLALAGAAVAKQGS